MRAPLHHGRSLAASVLLTLTTASPAAANGYLFFHDHQFDESGGTVYLGRVTDNEGRGVPNAQVQITILDFNQAITLSTNATGRYKSAGVSNKVKPSQVRVSVLKAGYRVLKTINLSRSAKPGTPQEINFVLAKKRG